MPAAVPTRSRLTRAARREQLLDAAGRLLVSCGPEAVTMEGLAKEAGVSKALPYSHFDNSDAVLVALYQRVVGDLGKRILRAVDDAVDGEDLVGVIVRTFIDTVADLGPVLRAVTTPGSPSARLADADQRVGPTFVAQVMIDHFDITRKHAVAVAPVILASLVAAVGAWSDGVASRRQTEKMAVAVLRALLDARPR